MAEQGQEIERLVVRLVGDVDNYLKALNQAQEHSKHAADEVEHAAHRVEGMVGAFEHVSEGIMHAVQAAAGFEMLHSMFERFEEAENTMLKLESTLRANGRDVEELTEDYKRFAEQMSLTTTVSKVAALQLAGQAESFGLTGEQAKQAAKEAAALGEYTGMGAQAMMRLTAAMAQGDVATAEHFKRMLPQLRQARDEEEFTAIYAKIVAASMEYMGAKADTVGGQLEKLNNRWHETQEAMGKSVSEAIQPAVRGLSSLLGVISGLPEWAKESAVTLLMASTACASFGAIWPLISGGISKATASLTSWTGQLTMAIAAGIALGKAIYDANQDLKDLGDEEKRNIELTDKLIASRKKSFDAQLESASRESGESRTTALQDILDGLIKERDGVKRQIDAAKGELEKTVKSELGLSGSLLRGMGFEHGDIFGNKLIKGIEDSIASADKSLKEFNTQIDKTKEKLNEDKGPALTKKMAKELDDLIAKLNEQRKAIEAGGEAEAKLQEFREKGAGFFSILEAGIAVARLKEAKATAEVRKEVEHLIKSTEKEAADKHADALGVSKLEAQIERLKSSGNMSWFETTYLRMLNIQIEGDKKIEEENKRIETLKKSLEEPAEKQAELSRWFARGKLTAEEYAKAMEKLAGAMHEVTMQSALLGTAEDYRMRSQYFSGLPGRNAFPMAPLQASPASAPANYGVFGRNTPIEERLREISTNTKRMAEKNPIEIKEAGF